MEPASGDQIENYMYQNFNQEQYMPTTSTYQCGEQNYFPLIIPPSNEKSRKPRTKKTIKKEKKSFVSEKITDTDFPFYACSVCDITFLLQRELDSHVTEHKDRITSYDLKIRNQLRKKKLKKEKKKKKLKEEVANVTIEIKPEEGYIGSKKASDVANEEKFVPNDKMNDVIKKQDLLMTDEAKRKELLNLEKIYKCHACKKQFSLSYYLKLHVRSHTDEKPYTCDKCGQSFITASKLGRHNKRIHLAIHFTCRICYKKYYRFELLTDHFDKKHAEDKLEGEPYDFNAILPYLKEIEEQLREKQENEKQTKMESLWDSVFSDVDREKTGSGEQGNAGSQGGNVVQEKISKQGDKVESEVKEELEIKVEIAQVLMDEVIVKVEPVDDEFNACDRNLDGANDDGDDGAHIDADDCSNNGDGIPVDNKDDIKEDVKEDDVKDDGSSDEDYFPDNTWTSKLGSPPPANAPLQCPVCNKVINKPSYLRVHMRIHTGERPYKCYICGAGFITATKMHSHAMTHPEAKDELVKVETVKVEFEPCADENDNDKKKVKKKKKALKKQKEIEKIRKKRPHACDYCQKRFLHMETLLSHKRSLHAGETIKHVCKFCLEESEDAAALKEHESTHVGATPYVCTLCGKCYKKRESMMYHRKSHKTESNYICDICTKSFNAQCKLQRHLLSHTTEKFILKYECPVCAHMFNTKYHIQMHLATHQREGIIHEENRNQILAMVLQNARKIPKEGDSSLLTVIPTDERSRVCNICGEVFQHFYYLEEHLKSHGSKIAIENVETEEEKKHVCEVCNKGFKLHYYLKLHSFTHTKEKPFICQQCGKGFITRGKLKRHLETHSGLKKYQCHICYKFFTRPSYLRIHVRTIHGTQVIMNDKFGLEAGLNM
ncbi:zinc finger protein 699-like [Leptidea sinapis]|uniref:zinc finger protein 699-like n=1 Tax=Leptidea sinapis TaxID=189913 RepID=UPI00213A5309|nr:zinc finger protein 699-like [Leptidea sinapis]